MPRIRVLAGPSQDSLEPITANLSKSHKIQSPHFEGEVAVFLKNFIDEHGNTHTTDYFDHPERIGKTWAIQFRGRFVKPISGDELLFGNVFDRPLTLPYGSGAALKFLSLHDPTLEHDLQSDKPWALSPLIATLPFLSYTKQSKDKDLPSFQVVPIKEKVEGLVPKGQDRRSYFASAEHRKAAKINPSDILQGDFAHGFLSFDQGLALNLPIGLSFDLMKYWDGRPLCYVCCEKDPKGGPGTPYWCVAFQIVDEDGEDEDEDGEGEEEVPAATSNGISDDID